MGCAYLILADGTVFKGSSIGATGSTLGETVFTTGMTGYLETLTDPSYYGQIVTQTFPLIGNYGVINEDFESKQSWVRGYIVRELCELPSNFRCMNTLSNFLKSQGIIGICGIDTRALTKRLRESGVMNGMIVSGKEAEKYLNSNSEFIAEPILQNIKAYNTERAVEQVSNKESEPSTSSGNKHVILWDFGAKANIQRELEKRGCKVTVVPYNTKAEEILKLQPDGIMLSNGPGDPAENVEIIPCKRRSYSKT